MPKHRFLAPLLALALAAPAVAEEDTDRALVHLAQFPAADLVQIPLREELRLRQGARARTGSATLFDPSFPTAVAEDAWNLVHRIHVGLVWQPEVLARTGGYFGMTDLGYELYLAPARVGGFDWGVGGSILLPSATDDHLGEHSWASGLAVAMRWASGPWGLALSGKQLWTWATTGVHPKVNRLTLQPSLTYVLPGGWFLQSAPVLVFDEQSSAWTVPLGAGAGKLFSPAGQKLLVSVQAYRTATAPAGPLPDWSVQLGASLLFPR